MILYVISGCYSSWEILRFANDSSTIIERDIATEIEAYQKALLLAGFDTPSNVVRITETGASKLIASLYGLS